MSQRKCDHCDGVNVIDDCQQCGAPQCCKDCCDTTTRELLAKPERLSAADIYDDLDIDIDEYDGDGR